MTRVLHRAVNRTYPVAGSGSGICHSTAPASSISTPAAERRFPALVTATPTCWRPCRPSSTSWPMRLRASSPPPGRGVGASARRAHAARHVQGGFLQQWLRGHRACLKMARHYFAERANLAAENSLGVASPITASGLGRCPSAGRAGAGPRGRRSACSAGPFGWQCRWPQRRPGFAGTAIHRHGPRGRDHRRVAGACD
jgi:hypothetical protein